MLLSGRTWTNTLPQRGCQSDPFNMVRCTCGHLPLAVRSTVGKAHNLVPACFYSTLPLHSENVIQRSVYLFYCYYCCFRFIHNMAEPVDCKFHADRCVCQFQSCPVINSALTGCVALEPPPLHVPTLFRLDNQSMAILQALCSISRDLEGLDCQP